MPTLPGAVPLIDSTTMTFNGQCADAARFFTTNAPKLYLARLLETIDSCALHGHRRIVPANHAALKDFNNDTLLPLVAPALTAKGFTVNGCEVSW